MGLNKPQRVAVCLAALVIVGMLAYPPYVTTWTVSAGDFVRSLDARSYNWLLVGPDERAPSEVVSSNFRLEMWGKSSRLDLACLVVQCVAVAVVAAAVAVGLGARRPKVGVVGGGPCAHQNGG